MFLEELEDLKDRYRERLHLIHMLSREPQEVELFSGRLDADRMKRLLGTLISAESVDEWFLCGPFDDGDPARERSPRPVSPRTHPRRAVPRRGGPAAPRAHEHQDEAGGATVTIVLDGRRSSFP